VNENINPSINRGGEGAAFFQWQLFWLLPEVRITSEKPVAIDSVSVLAT